MMEMTFGPGPLQYRKATPGVIENGTLDMALPKQMLMFAKSMMIFT